MSFDALLLLSFGGPEGPDDVVPFLERVTAGRGIPPERLVEVGAHYYEFGGRSPLNDQNRELLAALRARAAERGLELGVYWGNRNWHPFVTETLREMAADGVRRAAVFATSAYSSYSGCRQYQEDLAAAVAALAVEGVVAPELVKIPPYWNQDGFVEPQVDAVVAACAELAAGGVEQPLLLFSTHSIPETAAASSGPVGAGGAYVAQHRAVAGRIAAEAAARLGRKLDWELVFQSRSGPPHVPWLEPDVGARIAELAGHGVQGVVVVPVGFTSDHIEVLWDLDRVALTVARDHGVPAVRSATVGADPRYVDMVLDLTQAPVVACPAGCCAAPTRPGAAGGGAGRPEPAGPPAPARRPEGRP